MYVVYWLVVDDVAAKRFCLGVTSCAETRPHCRWSDGVKLRANGGTGDGFTPTQCSLVPQRMEVMRRSPQLPLQAPPGHVGAV